jgi:putative hydrolase of the HAD superfamily
MRSLIIGKLQLTDAVVKGAAAGSIAPAVLEGEIATVASLRRPRALLFDYGGTLVEELAFDTRVATEWLLERAELRPGVSIDQVVERARRISREVADLRDTTNVETPWVALTRLIHDALGTAFREPVEELELGFWNAAVRTRPWPGVREALEGFRRAGIPMGVVSNTSFSQGTIRHELSKHGLDEFMDIIVVSSEYAVRKPNPLIFEAAAGLLGVPSAETWFVGDRIDTDVDGANAAGMTALLVSPNNAMRGLPTAICVSQWSEIATMVHDASIA